MSLHHLYFLLGRLQELGIETGPMNIRLDNIDSETSGNYVSFLSEFQRKQLIPSGDTQSIHSMSSVKSVMSSVSALWNSLAATSGHYDNITVDLKYLYSAFTKLPCLRIANDPKAKLIAGHEEYPFETATPVTVFQNLVVLEVSEIDPKEVYGWDFLSHKVRYLVIKKAGVQDPVEILVNLVNDDAERRGAESENGPEEEANGLTIQQPPQQQNIYPYSSSSLSSAPNLHPDQTVASPQQSPSIRRKYYYYQPAYQHRRQHRANSIISEHSVTSDGSNTTEKPESPRSNDPDAWSLLKHLSFADNRITQITPSSFVNLANLSSLDLSYNRLMELPEKALEQLPNLKSLNLAFNKLTTTKGFPQLSKLGILNLRGNRLTNLDSLENLRMLEKLDLRQNRLSKVADLKPLLILNTDKVRLRAVYLAGNPLSTSRTYRIELFNLFNGVEYTNNLKLDGSRPGIFESRLLLDPKGAKLKLHKFLDAQIISKMTASISSMNLGKVISSGASSKRSSQQTDKSLADITEQPQSDILATNKNAVNTNSYQQPHKPFAPQRASSALSVATISTTSTAVTIRGTSMASTTSATTPTSIMATNASASPSHSVDSRRTSQDSNPITKITIASAALPIITQTTTTITTEDAAPAVPAEPAMPVVPTAPAEPEIKVDSSILCLLRQPPEVSNANQVST